MIKKNAIYFILLSFKLTSCIEPYEGEMKSIDNILVVEGMITGGTTQIILSKSGGLDDMMTPIWDYQQQVSKDPYEVNHAEVFVECDDGARTESAYPAMGGIYRIETGELNMDAKYRLVIHLDGELYHSNYIAPAISSPPFISFKNDGANISVCVSTKGYEGYPGYYLWSYEEEWETQVLSSGAKCRMYEKSNVLILGNTEKMIENEIREQTIKSFHCTDSRTSILYRIKVSQNTIHKEAYDYLFNVQKNSSWNPNVIFGHIPSEIMGNIKCVSNPEIPVIGYVDVSTTSVDEQYVDDIYYDSSFEVQRRWICAQYSADEMPSYCYSCGW